MTAHAAALMQLCADLFLPVTVGIAVIWALFYRAMRSAT